MSDWWPPIKVKRFSGECAQAYEHRRAEIVAIISGFRKGRFEGSLAEKLDKRLEGLLSGDYEECRFDPFGVVGWDERPRTPQVRIVEAA